MAATSIGAQLTAELSEERQKLQDGAIEFARAELDKDVIRRDREEEFSREAWKKCAAFGVLHEGGFRQRALIVIGPDGVLRWSYQAPSPGELPGLAVLREGLASSQGPGAAG